MKYMGSKNRIAKYIVPIMLSAKKEGMAWVEPFIGGANAIDKVDGVRIGADINPNVIGALKAIRDNVKELPKNNKEFTEADFKRLKKGWDYKFLGYAGFAFSYGGKWFDSWCRDGAGKRDYVREAYRNAVKQSPKLQGVKLVVSDYRDLDIPKNSLIYCDPPYKGTGSYRIKKKIDFDYEEFWEWCRRKNKEGHTVFVSGYEAPDDFKCLWQKEIVSGLGLDTGSKRSIEKLFQP